MYDSSLAAPVCQSACVTRLQPSWLPMRVQSWVGWPPSYRPAYDDLSRKPGVARHMLGSLELLLRNSDVATSARLWARHWGVSQPLSQPACVCI